MGRLPRWVRWTAAGLVALGAARLAARFPWRGAAQAVLDTDVALLLAALAVNLVSLMAKGWAWQLILRPVQKVSWRAAQIATLAGAAVTNLATSVVGEAARIQVLGRRTGVSLRPALVSVLYLRAVEGLALAALLIVAPLVLPAAPELRAAEAGAAIVILLVLLVLAWRPTRLLAPRLPRRIQEAAAALEHVATARALPAPLALALLNWVAQWITYALVLSACGVDAAWQASFVALVATNLAGLVPVSPGNVGVFQAAIVLGLMPLGVGADRAVVAGISLQVIQIPPVLALAAGVLGLSGLRQLRRTAPRAPQPEAAREGATA